MLTKRIKRFLYLLHRWTGVGFAILFLLWFASGIIMMYVEFPELTPPERYAHLPDLNLAAVAVTPDEALANLPPEAANVTALELATVLGRPAYLVTTAFGQRYSLFADDGTLVRHINPEAAGEAASAFVGGAAVRGVRQIDLDQWSVSGNLNPYRPLYKVALADRAGSILYVSEHTGQVVRDTTRWERGWNWLGAVVHWIYPAVLRQHPGLWSDVVIYVSLGGCLAALTGIVVGYWRLRVRRRYKSGSTSPFSGWQYWHHIGGMVCAVFVCTFIFSGLMSMNPWGVFDNDGEGPAVQRARFTGGTLDLARFTPEVSAVAHALPAGFQPRVVEWLQQTDLAYLLFIDGTGRRVPVAAAPGETPTVVKDMAERVAALAPRLLPGAHIVESRMLTGFDNYYYSHHQRYRPLPVLRVRFDDAADTWYHLDPVSGEVRSRLTHTDRVERWLYNGLHSLDLHVLMGNRPLWDIVVILLSVLGTAFSLTGIVIAWRRIKHKAKHKPAPAPLPLDAVSER